MSSLLLLSLLWLLLGLLIGLLANAALLTPTDRGRRTWLVLPGLAGLIALCTGWLGILLLGKFFATFVAIWCTVLIVMVFAGFLTRKHAHPV